MIESPFSAADCDRKRVRVQGRGALEIRGCLRPIAVPPMKLCTLEEQRRIIRIASHLAFNRLDLNLQVLMGRARAGHPENCRQDGQRRGAIAKMKRRPHSSRRWDCRSRRLDTRMTRILSDPSGRSPSAPASGNDRRARSASAPGSIATQVRECAGRQLNQRRSNPLPFIAGHGFAWCVRGAMQIENGWTWRA